MLNQSNTDPHAMLKKFDASTFANHEPYFSELSSDEDYHEATERQPTNVMQDARLNSNFETCIAIGWVNFAPEALHIRSRYKKAVPTY